MISTQISTLDYYFWTRHATKFGCTYHVCSEWRRMRMTVLQLQPKYSEVFIVFFVFLLLFFLTQRRLKITLLHFGLSWCTMLLCLAMEVVFSPLEEINLHHKLHFASSLSWIALHIQPSWQSTHVRICLCLVYYLFTGNSVLFSNFIRQTCMFVHWWFKWRVSTRDKVVRHSTYKTR